MARRKRSGGSVGGGGGGTVPNTTPPESASGNATHTNTSSGNTVNDSAFSQASIVRYTDFQNKDITTKEIDGMIKHSGIPADFGGEIRVTRYNNGEILISINGQGVSMSRSIDKDNSGNTFVYNRYFKIDEGTKYDGRGWEIFNNQVNYLTNNKTPNGDKASLIKVDAAGNGPKWGSSDYNGYYTWLRFGYKPDGAWDSQMTYKYNQATNSNAKNAREMMSTKAGQDWWRENGRSWEGTFDLRNGSESRQILSSYARERAKKKK